MAELYRSRPWTYGDRLSTHLEQYLPEEYIVLPSTTVFERTLDALLVGPQGLFVLHCKGWEGEVEPARQGPWRERLDGGREIQHRNPAVEVQQATKALRAFLADEFPSLRLAIHHLLVLTNPAVQMRRQDTTDPPTVMMSAVTDAVVGTAMPGDEPELDPETREVLAQALSERRLALSQKAAAPFLMGPKRRLRPGRAVWTVRSAIAYLDRHPEEGVSRLLDGSLATWLSEQGAPHVARLARDAVLRADLEPRDTLERFLIDTGLVPPPRLLVRPHRLNMGYVLPEQSSTRVLQLRKGWGRGHLFGSIGCGAPWLRVQPAWFSGGPVRVTVTATAHELPVGGKPAQDSILVHSSAAPEPTEVPVHLRVVGAPSRLARGLLRPLAGMAAASLVGIMLGWALGRWGIPAPSVLTAQTTPALPSSVVWVGLLGLPSALLGWIRGRSQPASWPSVYAIGRWGLDVLTWGAFIAVLAAGGRWAWLRFDTRLTGQILDSRGLTLLLLSLGSALLPACLVPASSGATSAGAATDDADHVVARRTRPAVLSVALAAFLVAAIHMLGPGGRVDLGQAGPAASRWAQQQWVRWERALGEKVEQVYIRLYDRRAPLQATPTPQLVGTPAARQPGAEPLEREK
jgi:hypothetical protein